MTNDTYSADEQRFLEAWLTRPVRGPRPAGPPSAVEETFPRFLLKGKPLSIEDEDLLEEWGFDHDPCSAYTRLDAWVGAFAVRDIQERLPNCGICREEGVILKRPIVKNRRSKRHAGKHPGHEAGPGLQWLRASFTPPVAEHLGLPADRQIVFIFVQMDEC